MTPQQEAPSSKLAIAVLSQGQLLHVALNTGERLHNIHASKIIIPAYGAHLTLTWADGRVVTGVREPLYCAPDVTHGVACSGPALTLFAEPLGQDRRLITLASQPDQPFHKLPKRLHAPLIAMAQDQLDHFNQPKHAQEIYAHTLEILSEHTPTPPSLDLRVEHALELIHTSQDNLTKLTLPDLARQVHLSEGRLRHLFSQQLGISFKRYLLWQKLHRAITMWQSPSAPAPHLINLTTLAHEAGFSDLAHFSRTALEMTGQRPSYLQQQ